MHRGDEMTLEGPSPGALRRISREGYVQAALCSRTDLAVLDREVAFRFPSQSEKDATLSRLREPFLAFIEQHRAVHARLLPGRACVVRV